ncbi:hypothetical protein Metli_0694 [Methanofollis liminatans DSM 4140]|uniref:Uncharacterized protein n=1 Tax=Methanofollis liminatans DSM 4140 TaxID=28892 RepID=J1AP20_9EURY|nr:hypothetical protein [Methanofollis liminatans]EJG06658.1 hypothetical protein Metli_0694 [Methanofollis liminatans DSM 4140]
METAKTVLTALVAIKARAIEKQNAILLNDDAVGMIDAVIGMAIGLIVLVAVFSIAPVIGSNIDSSVTIPAGSQWNSTTNADMTTGVEIWTQNSALLILAVMVSILSLVIFSIMRIRGSE